RGTARLAGSHLVRQALRNPAGATPGVACHADVAARERTRPRGDRAPRPRGICARRGHLVQGSRGLRFRARVLRRDRSRAAREGEGTGGRAVGPPARGVLPRHGGGTGDRAAEGSQELSALEKIEHLVVLMLENRSFDHMLGYLSLEGGREDIDGLKAGMANEYGGRAYPIHHLKRTAFLPVEDPDHSGEATSVQIAGGDMSGFVDSFAAKLAQRSATGHDPGLVMGYYNAGDLPVYDHLAAEFCVCDRW